MCAAEDDGVVVGWPACCLHDDEEDYTGIMGASGARRPVRTGRVMVVETDVGQDDEGPG